MNELEPSVTGFSDDRSQLWPKAAPVAIAPPASAMSNTTGVIRRTRILRRRDACCLRRSTRLRRALTGVAGVARWRRSRREGLTPGLLRRAAVRGRAGEGLAPAAARRRRPGRVRARS